MRVESTPAAVGTTRKKETAALIIATLIPQIVKSIPEGGNWVPFDPIVDTIVNINGMAQYAHNMLKSDEAIEFSYRDGVLMVRRRPHVAPPSPSPDA